MRRSRTAPRGRSDPEAPASLDRAVEGFRRVEEEVARLVAATGPSPDETAARDADERFSIVVLCTGNRIRSPVAEAAIGRLTAGLPVEVESYGTLDLGPGRAVSAAVAAARDWGLDLAAHRARTVSGASLATADLVLGFDRTHVATAVVEAGAARERTFTLPELVELLEQAPAESASDPVARARRAVELAHRRRAADADRPLAAIEDPIGRGDEVVRRTAREVYELSHRLVEGLFGDVSASGLPPPGPGRRRRRFTG